MTRAIEIGESACAAFEPLRRFGAEIRGGEVHVALAAGEGDA